MCDCPSGEKAMNNVLDISRSQVLMVETDHFPDHFGSSRSEFVEAQAQFGKHKTEFEEIENLFGKL